MSYKYYINIHKHIKLISCKPYPQTLVPRCGIFSDNFEHASSNNVSGVARSASPPDSSVTPLNLHNSLAFN